MVGLNLGAVFFLNLLSGLVSQDRDVGFIEKVEERLNRTLFSSEK